MEGVQSKLEFDLELHARADAKAGLGVGDVKWRTDTWMMGFGGFVRASHNNYHYLHFFRHIRLAISQGKFAEYKQRMVQYFNAARCAHAVAV